LIAAFALAFFAVTAYAQPGEVRVRSFEFTKQSPSISDEQRAEIFRLADVRRRQLAEAGALNDESPQIVLFEWPIRPAAHLIDPGCYGISGFVDHNPAFPNHLTDYNCGTRTYDLDSGYNHRGTDIFNWPFLFNKMDNDDVEIVAAAGGEIFIRQDGNYDRNCGFGSGDWNGVGILHSDGSIAVYGHMKSGSVTTKQVGQTVTAGEYLGVVGSSGSSSGPHLHFEVWDAGDNLIDPWQGPCNVANPTSWWIDQKPYYDSALNKISTHSSWVEWMDCPLPDVQHFADSFLPGSTVYMYAFGRDALRGDVFDFAVYRPDGSTYESWSWVFDEAQHWPAFALGFSLVIPAPESTGDWKYAASYNGVDYEHTFEISWSSIVAFDNVNAEVIDEGITVTWSLYTDEELIGFEVYRSTGSSPDIRISGPNPLPVETRRFVDVTAQLSTTYFYTVSAIRPDGSSVRSRSFCGTSSGPDATSLAQNRPNPFNPSTVIDFELSEPSTVVLAVYDAQGRQVIVLEEGTLPAGDHKAHWDGRDRQGNRVGSGTYFYRLRAGKTTLTGKMVLLK
jgi:murein DD-endopeptidase MepM/ murein hydrolase activator NlpD